jgi:hypothetical protein
LSIKVIFKIMMEDKTNYLQRLRVAAKGGGSLVSHSPIFSKDSK